MAKDGDEGAITLLDLLQALVSNWRLLVLGPLVAGALAYGITFLISPKYTARTTFFPPQQQQSAAASMLQSLGSLGGLAGAAAGIKNPATQYVTLLESRTLRDALVNRFHLEKRYNAEWREMALRELGNNTVINASKDGLISIDVHDRDPVFAANLANAHVDELRKVVARLALTESQQRRQFFEKQLEQTKNHLAQAELALRNTGVNLSALKANPESAVGAVARLHEQITAQEVRLAGLRRFATDSSMEVKEAKTALAALQREQEKISRTDPTGDRAEEDYVARYREMKYHETLFEMFAKQFELAKVDEAKDGPLIQVVDEATPPERTNKPKRRDVVIMTVLVTWFLFAVFVFCRQALLMQIEGDAVMARKLTRLRLTFRGKN